MSEQMTRRQFVAAGAVLGAGLALASAGCSMPGGEADGEVETPSTSYGGDEVMGKRVLVGYATRTGSTIGVAEAIGEVLGRRGYRVDVKPLRERPSLEGYDAAVLGSAINGGAWLPEAMAYLEANRDAFGRMPVAAFCVHAMNFGDDAKATKKRLAYLDKVREVVKPEDEGYFAGKGPTKEDSSAIARWAFKAFGGDAEGDARDWDKIRAWAEQAKV